MESLGVLTPRLCLGPTTRTPFDNRGRATASLRAAGDEPLLSKAANMGALIIRIGFGGI